MTEKKSYQAKAEYLLITYFFLWVILFEFILPANKILPKPTVVIQSFGDLWNLYNLPLNYLSTITAVYLSIIFAYYLLQFLSPMLVKREGLFSSFIFSLEWFSEYVPGIIIGLILIFWFPESEYIEFIFAFAAAFSSLVIKFQNESANVKPEYINAAVSLGADKNFITRKVIWKSVQPKLFEHLVELHLYIWMMLLMFEFIKGGLGLGTIYFDALEFRDLSALFSISIIIGVTIYFGAAIIKYLRNKFFFWGYN